ncbi:hypothetical protein ABTY59_37440 [Streptomyces sp. NPDC096079]|uniref:hypothetical protein n=1 Tax=Streptomyces sp. NPDC096079 TaxID=3155820 RepID=UPI003332996B
MSFNHPVEFDGIVIEDQNGNRLLAIPTAALEILRFAAVIQYRSQGRVSRMRVDGFMDGRPAGTPLPVRPTPPPPAAAAPVPTPAPAPLLVAVPDRWRCPNPECGCMVDNPYASCPWCRTPRPSTH